MPSDVAIWTAAVGSVCACHTPGPPGLGFVFLCCSPGLEMVFDCCSPGLEVVGWFLVSPSVVLHFGTIHPEYLIVGVPAVWWLKFLVG